MMLKHIGISALAFGVALAAAPAQAQLLNHGGGEPTVDVNLGNEIGATVDLGGTPDVTVDLNGDTGGDITVDLPTGDDNGSDDGLGDLLDLDDDDNAIGLDLDAGDDHNDVVVGLPGEDEVFVDLFGDDNNTGTRIVDLNTDADAILDLDTGEDGVIADLFGEGGPAPLDAAADLNLDLLDEGAGDLGVDLEGLLGGEVIADLFGEGGTVEALDLGDGALPEIGDVNLTDIVLPDIGGISEHDTTVQNLALPQVALPEIAGPNPYPPIIGTDGTDGVNGADGDDGGDGDTAIVVVNPNPVPDSRGVTTVNNDNRTSSTTSTTVISNRATATARTQVAAAGKANVKTNAKCFTPDDNQIAHLVKSRTYSNQAVSTWQNTSAVTLVPVQLCPEARVKVSEVTYADANMEIMRRGVARSAAVQQKLQGNGLNSDNVLAVDSKNGGLTVYVY